MAGKRPSYGRRLRILYPMMSPLVWRDSRPIRKRPVGWGQENGFGQDGQNLGAGTC